MKGTADSCLTSHPPPTNVGAKHTTPLPTGEGLGGRAFMQILLWQ